MSFFGQLSILEFPLEISVVFSSGTLLEDHYRKSPGSTSMDFFESSLADYYSSSRDHNSSFFVKLNRSSSVFYSRNSFVNYARIRFLQTFLIPYSRDLTRTFSWDLTNDYFCNFLRSYPWFLAETRKIPSTFMFCQRILVWFVQELIHGF